MTRRRCLTCGTDWLTFGPHDPCPSCGTVQRPEIGLDIRPVAIDNDGNGVWTDGIERWNSGEPLTADELHDLWAVQEALPMA